MFLLTELQQLFNHESTWLAVSFMKFLIITYTGVYAVHVLTRMTIDYLHRL